MCKLPCELCDTLCPANELVRWIERSSKDRQVIATTHLVCEDCYAILVDKDEEGKDAGAHIVAQYLANKERTNENG